VRVCGVLVCARMCVYVYVCVYVWCVYVYVCVYVWCVCVCVETFLHPVGLIIDWDCLLQWCLWDDKNEWWVKEEKFLVF